MTVTTVAVNTLSVTDANEGIRTVLVRLLPALHRVAPDLHQLLICSRANRGLLEDHVAHSGAEVVEVPLEAGQVTKRIAFDHMVVPRLVKERADVLFTPSSVGSLYSPIPQVVFVQAHLALPSCRELAGPDSLSRLHRFYYGPLLRRSLRRADVVLANSAFVADGLVRELGIRRDSVRPMPLGVDVHPEMSTVAAKEAVSESIVLFVGTLYEYKDARTAIRAFAIARPRLPVDARLVIVGRDPDDRQVAALRDEARLAGVEDAVELTGSISDDALDDLYRRARLLVMPSRCEGFGLPVAEAMALGTPVVVADATALPEVAGDAGLLVAVGDVRGFADAIMRIMNDPALQASMISSGLARSRELSWETTAATLRDAILGAAS